jgi:flagellar assembly protein FliH
LSDNNSSNQTAERKWESFKLESFDSVSKKKAAKDLSSEFVSEFSSENGHKIEFQITPFSGGGEDGFGPAGIVDAAKRKAAAIENDAYEKGFAQGEKDGLEMGTKKNEKVFENIHGILKDLVDEKSLQLIDLVARKVVETTVSINSGAVKETVLKALMLAIDRSEITVRVSPDDFDYVKEIKPDFFEKIDGLKSITITSDASVSHGGCYVETKFGDIDARLEKQLDKISESILNVFKEGLGGTPKR